MIRYKDNHIETETDIYTGYVTVTWWEDGNDKETDAVVKGGFRSIEAAIDYAKKEVDWFGEMIEGLKEQC